MGNTETLVEKLKKIADATRAKTGGDKPLRLDDDITVKPIDVMCVGVTPESWNLNCIRFYVVNSSTYGFTAHIFSANPIHITVDQNISGHHRLVFRCKCQGANSVSAWLDGKNIIKNAGSEFHAGSWSMSNAEGNTRFKGTYNEVSILKPYLTDEEYLEISKVE